MEFEETNGRSREIFNEVTTMRWFLSLGVATVFFGAGSVALAQRSATQQGPILVVPPTSGESYQRSQRSGPSSRTYGGTTVQRGVVPRFYGGAGAPRESRHTDAIRFEDPRMRQVAAWYRQFFGREMVRAERIHWENHFSAGSSLDDVLVSLLGSRDFYVQAGGKFESWLSEVAEATDVRLRRSEYDQWHDAYHREPDRFSFTRRFLTAKGVLGREGNVITGYRPGLSGHDIWDLEHDHSGPSQVAPYPVTPNYPGQYFPGQYHADQNYAGSDGRPGYIPPYVAGPHHDHHGEHTSGYRPPFPARPTSNPELIAGWYRTYFGREIAPHELNKWLSDLNKGMDLDEVYASVLAAPEWYARTGSTPPGWIAATLEAQGTRADQDAVRHWLRRFERNKSDRFETALEMVRSSKTRPGR